MRDKNWILWRALRFFSLDLLGTRHGSKNRKGQSWLHDWNSVGDRLTLRCDFFRKIETHGYFNKEWLQKSFQEEHLQVPKIQTDRSAGRFFCQKAAKAEKPRQFFFRVPSNPSFPYFRGKKTKVEIRRAGWKSGQLNCRHPLSPPALTWRKSNYLAKKKTRARLTISQHFRGILEEYSRRYNGGEHTPFPYMRDKRVIISIITGFQDLFWVEETSFI